VNAVRDSFFDASISLAASKFLPEADDRIQRQHEKDEDKVFPMSNHRREYRGAFWALSSA
jgi:hypothetical protein